VIYGTGEHSLSCQVHFRETTSRNNGNSTAQRVGSAWPCGKVLLLSHLQEAYLTCHSISALPAGLQDRQVLTPPRQSVTFESGDPQPTPEPSDAVVLPPIFPPKPSDQISLGTPSYWVSWETDTAAPTKEPEEPVYPAPGKPTDQFSIGKPSFWVSWDTGSPAPTPAPETPDYPAPGKPTDQISLGTPSYWVSWETDGPAPTPTPQEPDYPTPGKPTDQISLGSASYWISWDGQGPSTPVPEPPKSSAVTPPKSSSKPEPPKSSPKPSTPASPSTSKLTTTKKPDYPEVFHSKGVISACVHPKGNTNS
jgi:hypothetical protein